MPVVAPFCRQCGMPYPAMEKLTTPFTCADCAGRRWYFEWARAAHRTAGRTREAVVGFKYGDQYYRRRQLVEWLTVAYDEHASRGPWDGLVPVPLYHRRYRERGFNQSHELARGLSKSRKLRLSDCLYRYRETVSQTTLERDERWANMTGAFRMKRGFDVTGRHLLIIDDVFTTGATANACAQVLARAGAARLAVLTVARS